MKKSSTSVTHICLIGDDPTANLTPVVDNNISCHRLVVAHELCQLNEYKLLEKVTKIRGYQVASWLLPTTCSTEAIKLSFMQLFERELNRHNIKTSTNTNNQTSQIWLNASNGSRYQVLSAYEVARSYGSPIFVVEPKQDALCWLYPEDWPLTPVNDKIKLHEFFSLNGCQLISQKNKRGIPKKLRDLGERWLMKANKLHSGLAKLNYLAMISRGEKHTSQQDKTMLEDQSLQWLLDDLAKNNLIEIAGKRVNFIDPDTVFFCNGGWLEEITFSFIRGLAGELKTIQDDGHSVEVERKVNRKKVVNELDVVVLVNNKLHVIECKTKRFEKGEGNKVLYKLDSLAERLGGIKAKAALVTFFPIRDVEVRRAAELEIQVFGVEELPRLKECLQAWMAKS